MPGQNGTGPMGQGMRRGRGGGSLRAGPGGSCMCAQCGHRQAHEQGRPCNQITCPQCGAPLTREA